jgi:hypothetical protein
MMRGIIRIIPGIMPTVRGTAAFVRGIIPNIPGMCRFLPSAAAFGRETYKPWPNVLPYALGGGGVIR